MVLINKSKFAGKDSSLVFPGRTVVTGWNPHKLQYTSSWPINQTCNNSSVIYTITNSIYHTFSRSTHCSSLRLCYLQPMWTLQRTSELKKAPPLQYPTHFSQSTLMFFSSTKYRILDSASKKPHVIASLNQFTLHDFLYIRAWTAIIHKCTCIQTSSAIVILSKSIKTMKRTFLLKPDHHYSFIPTC